MGLFRRIEQNANARKYVKAIDQSCGLKKVFLMVRNHGTEFTFRISSAQNGSKLIFILMKIASAQNVFTDAFFTTLNDSIARAGGSTDKMFKDLGDELYENYDKQKLIASRLYGISLAIVLHKAAEVSNKKVNEKEVLIFVESSNFAESLNKGITDSFSSMMNYYNDPMTGVMPEAAMASFDLGALAYSLLNKKLEKGNYADPLYTMAMATAEALSYRETNVSESDISELTRANLIK